MSDPTPSDLLIDLDEQLRELQGFVDAERITKLRDTTNQISRSLERLVIKPS